ncbi:hypothetical protein GCM10009853_031980 [Glycomyces scopariae]
MNAADQNPTAYQPTESISSTNQDQSVPSDESPEVIGEQILRDAGLDRTNDTLARWLAHHIAELMSSVDEAKRTGTPEEAVVAAEQCRRAVLDLWNHQRTLRTGYPLQAGQLIRSVMKRTHRLSYIEQPPQSVLNLEQIHHLVMGMLTNGNIASIEYDDEDSLGSELDELFEKWGIPIPEADADMTEILKSTDSSTAPSEKASPIELLAGAYYIAAADAVNDVRSGMDSGASKPDD